MPFAHRRSSRRPSSLVLLVLLLVAAGAATGLARPAAGGAVEPTSPPGPRSFALAAGPGHDRVLAELSPKVNAGAATIFGPDDRVPVSDPAAPPWRGISYLLLYSAGDVPFGRCSGTLLSATVVLTAAHCLYDGGVAVTAVIVAPGADPAARPVEFARATRFSIPDGWLSGQRAQFDFGLIFLEEGAFATLEPFAPLTVAPGSVLEQPATVIATAGYPADSTRLAMFYTETKDFAFDERFIVSTLDAVPGQSGSPIFLLDGAGKPAGIIGILTRERDDENLAVRISDDVVAALAAFCLEQACTAEAVRLPSAYTVSGKGFCRALTRCAERPGEPLLSGQPAGFAFSISPRPARTVTTRAFVEGVAYGETRWTGPPYGTDEVFASGISSSPLPGMLVVEVYVGDELAGVVSSPIVDAPHITLGYGAWALIVVRE